MGSLGHFFRHGVMGAEGHQSFSQIKTMDILALKVAESL
jgi:hypothetical protein